MTPEQRIVLVVLAGLLLLAYVILRLSLFGTCDHTKVRCLHGDEINHRMKVYVLRFWKPEVVRRQVCRVCGVALDRAAICTATGKDLHEWEGPWPYTDRYDRAGSLAN